MSTTISVSTGSNYGTLPTDEIGALLHALDAGRPWRAALEELDLPELGRKPDWFTNARKAAFYLSLAEPGDATAVDIGAGSGVIAGELARRFPNVVALERDPRWCRFMRRRFEQDGLRVDVLEMSALDSALPVHGVDVAVVNGVLEWVASGDDPRLLARSPRDVQVDFLRHVRSRLSPRGRIGIGIENRIHYENFRGASPHSEPPYAVIAPRPVAEWMTRRARGESYRTWIYGARGYARLLREAGFVDVQVRAVLPSYHRPDVVLPLSDVARIRAALAPARGLKARVLDGFAAAGWLGHLVHSFYISARRA